MSDTDFSVAITPPPVGCAGMKGHCRGGVMYLAFLRYCLVCEDTSRSCFDEHRTELCPVPLCVRCGAAVRDWTVLDSIQTFTVRPPSGSSARLTH